MGASLSNCEAFWYAGTRAEWECGEFECGTSGEADVRRSTRSGDFSRARIKISPPAPIRSRAVTINKTLFFISSSLYPRRQSHRSACQQCSAKCQNGWRGRARRLILENARAARLRFCFLLLVRHFHFTRIATTAAASLLVTMHHCFHSLMHAGMVLLHLVLSMLFHLVSH